MNAKQRELADKLYADAVAALEANMDRRDIWCGTYQQLREQAERDARKRKQPGEGGR